MLDRTRKEQIRIRPRKGKELKLDIGCGQRKQENHIGLDIAPCKGVDHVLDVRRVPWPIDDAVVDGIYTSHFFEHLDGPERMVFMDECWRVMKIGAQLIVIVPFWSSRRSIQDPTHKWPPIAETSFLYFVEHWRIDNKLTHYPIKCNFNFSYGYVLDPELNLRAEPVQHQAINNYTNAVMDIHVTLTKVALGKKA